MSVDIKFSNFLNAVKDGDLVKLKEHTRNEFVKKEDNLKLQPIHWACLYNRVEILKWLIENKCDIESSTKDGWRPIHFASLKHHKEIIKILIDNYCKVDCKTKDGATPFDIAYGRGNVDFVDHLNDRDENREIGLTMGLQCDSNCDHKFCLLSLSTGRFDKGELISRGVFGNIYKLTASRTGRMFAMKIIKDLYSHMNEMSSSIENNMNKYRNVIKHERIVQFYGSITIKNKCVLFMDYIAGGSIGDKIAKSGSLSHETIARYSKDVLEALAFLHKNKIIHRDVKGCNVLLDMHNRCKLVGFVVSISLDHANRTNERTNSFRGTPYYMAPEVICGEPYSYPVDIWSMGATIIEMLTGHQPFYHMNKYEVMYKIAQDKAIPFQPVEPMSDNLKSFIDLMLTPNPHCRPSAETLLQSYFLKEVPSDTVTDIDQENKVNLSDIACTRQDCINLIINVINNKQIGQSMGLSCNRKCDHKFCLSSLSNLRFKKGKLIGRGGFGSIHKINQSGNCREFALKSIYIGNDPNIEREAVDFEMNINKYRDVIRHCRIVQYFGVIRKSHKMLIFMEFVSGGSIKAELKRNRYKPLSVDKIRHYSQQILEGVAFLHEKRIIHRDIKPDNIVIDKNGDVKLVDFGLGKLLETISKNTGLANSDVGTANYKAPEVFHGENYGYPVDIWSVGATVVEMITGLPPYHNLNQYAVGYRVATTRKIDFEPPEPLSMHMKTFLDRMLRSDANERSSAAELLASDFFK